MRSTIPDMSQQRIYSETFEIIVERIPSDVLLYNRSYYKSGDYYNVVTMPIRNMI